MVTFRKSKTIGGIRFTASKRGLSVSAGKGPLRVSYGADGKVRRTVRIPGSGIYDTKVVGGAKKPRPTHPATASRSAPPAARPAPAPRPAPTPKHPLIDPHHWRELVEPDQTPRALAFQRLYVESRLGLRAGSRPKLYGLTNGQADRILGVRGEDTQSLRQSNRQSPGITNAALTALWALMAVCASFALAIPAVGPFITAGIIAVAGYRLVTRYRAVRHIAHGGRIPVPMTIKPPITERHTL